MTNRVEHRSPATDHLFSAYCAKDKVMVKGDCKLRHLRVYLDDMARYYVRIGKRGTVKEILTTARKSGGLVWVFSYQGDA